jgi:hypothetical protein
VNRGGSWNNNANNCRVANRNNNNNPSNSNNNIGFPGGSQLRPPVLDGTRLSEGLNRPLSCSHPSTGRDEMNKRPPGASRPAGAVAEALGGSLFYHSPASQFSPIHRT